MKLRVSVIGLPAHLGFAKRNALFHICCVVLHKQLDEHSIQHCALLETQKAATLAYADAIATTKGKAEGRAQHAIDATAAQHKTVNDARRTKFIS